MDAAHGASVHHKQIEPRQGKRLPAYVKRKWQRAITKKRMEMAPSAVAPQAPLLCDRPQTVKFRTGQGLDGRKFDGGLGAFDVRFEGPG